MQNPIFMPALSLSAKTSFVVWWLLFWLHPVGLVDGHGTAQKESGGAVGGFAHRDSPAVLGIALLQTFGRQGLLGDIFQGLGIQIPFSTSAVILAQVVVAAPFYIQSATTAFRRVNPDFLWVARTLGQKPAGAFLQVALPLALPGMISGAALSWARALGEFGATLLFAGNLSETTQTMPLAIYTAMESDVRAAVAISLVLVAVAFVLLLGLRLLPAVNPQTRRERGACPHEVASRPPNATGLALIRCEPTGRRETHRAHWPQRLRKTTVLRALAGALKPALDTSAWGARFV